MKRLFLIIIMLFSFGCNGQISEPNENNAINSVNNTNNGILPPVCEDGHFDPSLVLSDGFDCYGDNSDVSVACRQYCCDDVLTVVGMVPLYETEEKPESYFYDTENCGGCGVKCKNDAPFCLCIYEENSVGHDLSCGCTGHLL